MRGVLSTGCQPPNAREKANRSAYTAIAVSSTAP